MWKISEIKLRNIVSFKEAYLKFTQGVATLIFGKNEDNASQPCNGSGKSALIEAISLALTGEQLRKVKSIEEIINDQADEAYVLLVLTNDYDHVIFTIERTISRTAPQTIECHKYDAMGNEIDAHKTVQPSVADYNKFILDEIGLSKDDIYNNFILCDNKYESFFDCSDKSKKETINRFSNGIIVDESISHLQSDMEPVQAKLIEANSLVMQLKGSISAVENELSQAEQQQISAKERLQARLVHLDEQIQKCRYDIEEAEQAKHKGVDRMELLQNVKKEVKAIEGSETPLHEAYHQIKSICDTNELGKISNFDELAESYRKNLNTSKDLIKELKSLIKVAEKRLNSCRDTYNIECDKHNNAVKSNQEVVGKNKLLIRKIDDEIGKIDNILEGIESSIQQNKKRQAALEALIERDLAMIDGAITCPKCGHKFFAGNDVTCEDLQKELDDARKEIEEKESLIQDLESQYDALDEEAEQKASQIKEYKDSIKELEQEFTDSYERLVKLRSASREAESKWSTLKNALTAEKNRVEQLNGKIEILSNKLYGEINGILDNRIMNGEAFIEQQNSSITFLHAQLEQYQQSKRELLNAPPTDFVASLKESLNRYTSQLSEAESNVATIQSEYNRLKEQELHFTMFKSYLARKKIEALSLIVNDFLEKIGSDIRLRFEGFTVTKTGKLRDKISVQVIRDGVECGSYHKFSGGEKARLNLACILSLHTLTNSNCEDGKGLDFIIIDELLDKSDEVGMATYCEALNKLHQTALLITQGNVSEGYPHKLLVVKKQGVSSINQS